MRQVHYKLYDLYTYIIYARTFIVCNKFLYG